MTPSADGSGAPIVLIVHHTPSPAVRDLLETAAAAPDRAGLSGVVVRTEPALSATAADVLGAAALILITPANIGYMSGALKHFFDTVYYQVMDATAGLPYGLVVHGNDDTAGAVRSVTRIADALGWRPLRPPLSVTSGIDAEVRGAVVDMAGLACLAALGDD